MAVYKLQIDEDDLDDLNCKLIAIHTNLEEHRLAFLINKALKTTLIMHKKPKIVTYRNEEHLFSNYVFEELKNGVFWTLIQNKNELITAKETKKQDLFAHTNQSFSSKIYFLPEHKKVDYLLKVEGAEKIYETTQILSKINNITRVSAVYEIDIATLKSKNNLIF